VYAIEPHEAFAGALGRQFGPEDRGAFFRHMLAARTYRTVRLVNLPSGLVTPRWKIPVALLWLDGDHRYEAVRSDFNDWAPYLMSDAKVAFHDAADPELGPHRVVQELCDSGQFRLISGGGLSVIQRIAGAQSPS
jgi:hypothetical protein